MDLKGALTQPVGPAVLSSALNWGSWEDLVADIRLRINEEWSHSYSRFLEEAAQENQGALEDHVLRRINAYAHWFSFLVPALFDAQGFSEGVQETFLQELKAISARGNFSTHREQILRARILARVAHWKGRAFERQRTWKPVSERTDSNTNRDMAPPEDILLELKGEFEGYARRIHAVEWASYHDGETTQFVEIFQNLVRCLVEIESDLGGEIEASESEFVRRVWNRMKALCSTVPIPRTYPWRTSELFGNDEFRGAIWVMIREQLATIRGVDAKALSLNTARPESSAAASGEECESPEDERFQVERENPPQLWIERWGEIPGDAELAIPMRSSESGNNGFLQRGFYLRNDGSPAFDIKIDPITIGADATLQSQTLTRIGGMEQGFLLVWLRGFPQGPCPEKWDLIGAMATVLTTMDGNSLPQTEFSVPVFLNYRDYNQNPYRIKTQITYIRSQGRIHFGAPVQEHLVSPQHSPADDGVAQYSDLLSETNRSCDFTTKMGREVALAAYLTSWKCPQAALARSSRVDPADLSKWKRGDLPANSEKKARIEQALLKNEHPMQGR